MSGQHEHTLAGSLTGGLLNYEASVAPAPPIPEAQELLLGAQAFVLCRLWRAKEQRLAFTLYQISESVQTALPLGSL